MIRPCLTCDFLIPEHELASFTKASKVVVKKYPLSLYVVSGSQAAQKNKNQLYIARFSDLHKTKNDDDSEIFDEEDSENDEEPKIDVFNIKLTAAVNRVRSLNGTGIVAVYSENSTVAIYDCREHLSNLSNYIDESELTENAIQQNLVAPKDVNNNNFVLRSFKLTAEGFALDWSPLKKGKH